CSDIDIFVYDIDYDLLLEDIRRLISKVQNYGRIKMMRSKYAFTIEVWNLLCKPIIYQIILMNYKTLSHVLHGFDIDSCNVGYDGTNIWMTHRAEYALTQGKNTTKHNLLTDKIIHRLFKYAIRGMPIEILNMDKSDPLIVRLLNLER